MAYEISPIFRRQLKNVIYKRPGNTVDSRTLTFA